jgi:hypothetical protein
MFLRPTSFILDREGLPVPISTRENGSALVSIAREELDGICNPLDAQPTRQNAQSSRRKMACMGFFTALMYTLMQ